MPQVQTVTGPVDADELGLTLIHEHFRGRDEASVFQWPHLHDEDAEYALAVEQAEAVLGHGVRTVVEPTAMMLGRDLPFLQKLGQETGLQIVPCTGIYTYDHLPQFFANRDADFMAGVFAHDIEEGIQGTDARAAFIKIAADEPGVTDNIEKVHRAAARASLRTGAPIMAHSRPASATGPRQIEVLLEEGVDPSKIQIAHTGDTDDLDYIKQVLDTGVFIGMDRYGLPMFLPTENRNRTVLALLEQGHADRMLLSQDYVVAIDWFPESAIEQLVGGGLVQEDWSMTLLFESVIPTLREGGMTDEQLDTMMVQNPKRWLVGE
jgi:phosphotriesterase-related protein